MIVSLPHRRRGSCLLLISKVFLVLSFAMNQAQAWIPSFSVSSASASQISRAKSRLFFEPSLSSLNQRKVVIATTTTQLHEGEKDSNDGGMFGLFPNPNESKIPEELRKEIYAAEANTDAAKQRGPRVALYGVLALTGILCASFNVFISELRAPGADGIPGIDLTEAGFDWVQANFLYSFVFMNKIGGAICLLGGFGAGFMAELELDSKRVNAERIYDEMVRRREKKVKKMNKNKPRKKKARSGKETKRLTALSEVVLEDTTNAATEVVATASAATTTTTTTIDKENESPKATATTPKEDLSTSMEDKQDDKKGVFDQIKGFYEKADSMAASQALLLNKKLEDAGMIEKITDETGLKVVGRDEARKAQGNEGDQQDKTKNETK